MTTDVKKTLCKLQLLIAPGIKVIFVSEKMQKFVLVLLWTSEFWIITYSQDYMLHFFKNAFNSERTTKHQ